MKQSIFSDIHSQNGLSFTKAEIDRILQSGERIDAILNAGDMIFLSHTGDPEEKESEKKIELLETVIHSNSMKFTNIQLWSKVEYPTSIYLEITIRLLFMM